MPGRDAQHRNIMADIGTEAIEVVHRYLQPDERWLLRSIRGFSWVPFRLTQTIEASTPFPDKGFTLVRLIARTQCVRDVDGGSTAVLSALSSLNQHAMGSAYTFNEATRSIESTCIAFVHEDSASWRVGQFAAYAMMQVGMTHAEAPWLAEICQGMVATPSDGVPDVPDDFVSSLETFWWREGRSPSKYAGDEIAAIEAMAQTSEQAATWGADANGIAVEFPFGGETSLVAVRTDDPHRRVGNGLSVRSFLVMGEEQDLLLQANALNQSEAAGDSVTQHFGAWCVGEGPVGSPGKRFLQYQSFLPNGLHRVGYAQDALMGASSRVRWVDRKWHGVHSRADAKRTMLQNMRHWISRYGRPH